MLLINEECGQPTCFRLHFVPIVQIEDSECPSCLGIQKVYKEHMDMEWKHIEMTLKDARDSQRALEEVLADIELKNNEIRTLKAIIEKLSATVEG